MLILGCFAVRRRGFMAFDLPDHRQKLHFMLPGISIEHCLPGFPDLLVLARFPVQFLLFSLFVLFFHKKYLRNLKFWRYYMQNIIFYSEIIRPSLSIRQ